MKWTREFRKAVTFSYDDGNRQDIRLLEMLNTYGLKCTFNLNSGLNGNEIWKYKGVDVQRLNLEQCAELYKGHEIAVHGSCHLNPTELSPEELSQELAGNKAELTRIFGVEPVGMAYAYGCYNNAVINQAKEIRLKYGRTTEPSHSFDIQRDLMRFRPTCHHDDAMLFELAEKFLSLNPKKPQIFYVWGHSYEPDGNQNWDRLERLFEMLAGKNEIFYGTNAEILL
ncbi:MAG TPA: polysaccharide deacetylase [Ruminococcus sp.]|nr:polysaccharide deacetylase [Ruminococcus sp.]